MLSEFTDPSSVRFCLIENQILNMNKKNKWDGWAASAGNGSGTEPAEAKRHAADWEEGRSGDAQELRTGASIEAAFRG